MVGEEVEVDRAEEIFRVLEATKEVDGAVTKEDSKEANNSGQDSNLLGSKASLRISSGRATSNHNSNNGKDITKVTTNKVMETPLQLISKVTTSKAMALLVLAEIGNSMETMEVVQQQQQQQQQAMGSSNNRPPGVRIGKTGMHKMQQTNLLQLSHLQPNKRTTFLKCSISRFNYKNFLKSLTVLII